MSEDANVFTIMEVIGTAFADYLINSNTQFPLSLKSSCSKRRCEKPCCASVIRGRCAHRNSRACTLRAKIPCSG